MTATDMFGTEITSGDRVEFVYGGDRHEATVEDITESAGHTYVTVTPETIEIPAGSVRILEDDDDDSTIDDGTDRTAGVPADPGTTPDSSPTPRAEPAPSDDAPFQPIPHHPKGKK